MKKRYIALLMTSVLCAAPVMAQELAQEDLINEPLRLRHDPVKDSDIKVVTGTVVDDATGLPIPGARLQIIGARLSAMSDDEGKFQLKTNVTKEGVCLEEISVTAPGYNQIIVGLRNRESLTIRLMEEGYQTKTNRQVYTSLGMKEESHIMSAIGVYDRNNSTSVKGSPEAALDGQIAGLQTLFRSGTDWSGANLLLRGINSIYANNNPLIVVDGLVIENQEFGTSMIEGQISTPLGCIDIKDIDQIVVLKDATSIYGAKGSNGAILIRTRHTTDQATHVDVTALMGVNMQPRQLPMLGASDSKRLLTDIAQTSGLTDREVNNLSWINAKLPERQPNGTYLYADYYKYNQNTDWQDEIFQRGFKQQYSLSVTGGDDISLYGVSVGFQNKEGLVRGSDFQRFNARLNADIKMTERFILNANMNFVYGKKNLSNEGVASNLNPLYTALVKTPFTTLHDVDETNRANQSWEDVDALGAANPAAVVNDVVSGNSFYRFMGSFEFTAKLYKGLTLNENFGLDFNKERDEIFHPTIGIPYVSLPNADVTNEEMHRVERLFNILSETRLNYKSSFSDENHIDATLGLRALFSHTEDDYGKGYNSAGNAYRTIGQGDPSLHQIGGALGNANWISYYLHLDYDWEKRAFAQLTYSMDASSRYGSNVSTFLPYFGANVGWLLSNEAFMQSVNWLNLLKVRVGANTSGNDDITNYSNRLYYSSTQFLKSSGLVLGALENRDIKPEDMFKLNVGFDASLFDNRLNLSFDLYQSKITNMLTYSQVESYTGMMTTLSNGGEMKNHGFELSVNGRVFTNSQFSWDMSLNLAHNHNELTKLETGAFLSNVGDGSVLSRVGSSAGVFYGYKTQGVYSTRAEAAADGLKTMVGAIAEPFVAGDVRFVNADASNDVIDDNDRVEIGNPNPKLFGGLSSVMRSHRFTLQADFSFSLGNDIYNYTRSQLESMSSYTNQTKNTLLRWRTEGDRTSYPRASYGDPHRNNRFSDRWIEDGSYFKCKSISLSYDFNIKSEVLTGLTVYGACENVFCATKYSGYDPEICCSSSNNPLYRGVDAFTTPTVRTFYVGLKVGL